MDGKEQLRRYLEQRREAGETELVLDQLSVDEVLKLVGAATTVGSSRRAAPPSAFDRVIADPPPSTPGPHHASADWREVLRSTGVAPASAVPPSGLSVGSSDHELFGGAMTALGSLDAVARSVASCTRCPLYATATNPVPGVGNPNAGLMIVGEAPGATEDERGEPFVGAAGQLLTKILGAVDLKREDVFICNVLKHRPPGNRNPTPDEVTACSPYLFRQFELIRPKAILALGTFAAQTLLQTKLAIGKLRSQVHRFHGVPLIVTYHPAALLRNPSWKRPTWEDVQLVRRILDSAIAEP